MKPLSSKTLAAVILLGMLAVTALPVWQSFKNRPPDFAEYPAGEARKAAFFGYLAPLIDAENERWKQKRMRLRALQAAAEREDETISKRDLLWLDSQIEFFDVPREEEVPAQIEALLPHIDQVPRSLALAQAAKESAWGTSRFATDGHNYFGQRCYDKGCGLVPESRAAGAKFEVRRFSSTRASVRSYMNNINSHPEYEDFRDYRALQRENDEPLNGIQAAEQITQYSERRQAYVDEIQSLIHFNRLDRPLEAPLEQREEAAAETTAL